MTGSHRRRRLYGPGDVLLALLLLAVAAGYGWLATADWPGP